jgi:hypothetical protein
MLASGITNAELNQETDTQDETISEDDRETDPLISSAIPV